MKKTISTAALLCTAAVCAVLMIDTVHDRVQTTLGPGIELTEKAVA